MRVAAGRLTRCRGRGSRFGSAPAAYSRPPLRVAPRRPGRVHAAVRPRARRRARPRRRGRRARHVAVPLRRRRRAGRLPAPRALLSRLLAAVPPLAAAAAGQGARAPARDGPARAAGRPTSSTSSGSRLPQVDELLLRLTAPSVFTAHDLLPRRTAAKRDLWRRLLDRFARVVVHSERGRARLRSSASPADRAARHPAPRLPRATRRAPTTGGRCSRSA